MRRVPSAFNRPRLHRAPWGAQPVAGGAKVLTFPDCAQTAVKGAYATMDLSAAVPATAQSGDRVVTLVATAGGSSTPVVDLGPTWDPYASFGVNKYGTQYFAAEAAQSVDLEPPWSLVQTNATYGSGTQAEAVAAAVRGENGTPSVSARGLVLTTYEFPTGQAANTIEVPSPGSTLNPDSVALCFLNAWALYGTLTVSSPWTVIWDDSYHSGGVTGYWCAVAGYLMPSVGAVPACTWSLSVTDIGRYPQGAAWTVALG